jgi:hypothetical protein
MPGQRSRNDCGDKNSGKLERYGGRVENVLPIPVRVSSQKNQAGWRDAESSGGDRKVSALSAPSDTNGTAHQERCGYIKNDHVSPCLRQSVGDVAQGRDTTENMLDHCSGVLRIAVWVVAGFCESFLA